MYICNEPGWNRDVTVPFRWIGCLFDSVLPLVCSCVCHHEGLGCDWWLMGHWAVALVASAPRYMRHKIFMWLNAFVSVCMTCVKWTQGYMGFEISARGYIKIWTYLCVYIYITEIVYECKIMVVLKYIYSLILYIFICALYTISIYMYMVCACSIPYEFVTQWTDSSVYLLVLLEMYVSW